MDKIITDAKGALEKRRKDIKELLIQYDQCHESFKKSQKLI